MQKVLIVGCGDIGLQLASMLCEAGFSVVGLRRSITGQPFVHQHFKWLVADITVSSTLCSLTEEHYDYVVFCPTAGQFTVERYEQVYVRGVQNVLQALQCQPFFIHISSTSVYGQTQGEWVDESSITQPRFFSGAKQLAAEAAVRGSSMPHTIVRFAGIYGPGRNRLIQQVIKSDHGKIAAAAYTNRIHSFDCAAVIQHIIVLHASGHRPAALYLAVDDCPALMGEVKQYIAQQLAVAYMPDQNASPMHIGKRCSNRLLLSSGFNFTYANYTQGYAALLKPQQGGGA